MEVSVVVHVSIPVVQTPTPTTAKVFAAMVLGASAPVTKRPTVDVADPVYVKAYEAVHDTVRKWKRGKLEKMTTPEMNKFILDALWEKGSNHDCPD